VVATATTGAVLALEFGRVWRRGSAPLPQQTDHLFLAAEEAVAETVEVAVQGYREVSTTENAIFNMLASFVTSFAVVRSLAFALRSRPRFGPFRNVQLGRRHIHHFVPGIVLAFATGGTAIVVRHEGLDPWLALGFGAGMGMTFDESALLLDLEDVYWTPEGLLSVQITLATAALLGAVTLALRFLRRGEQVVLGSAETSTAGAPQPTA
jgi:hypothetical protein